jgi:hypothetical protein
MVTKFYLAILKVRENIKDESIDGEENMKLGVRK